MFEALSAPITVIARLQDEGVLSAETQPSALLLWLTAHRSDSTKSFSHSCLTRSHGTIKIDESSLWAGQQTEFGRQFINGGNRYCDFLNNLSRFHRWSFVEYALHHWVFHRMKFQTIGRREHLTHHARSGYFTRFPLKVKVAGLGHSLVF